METDKTFNRSLGDSDAARAYAASMAVIARTSPEIAKCIGLELQDQRSNLKLIASENFSSPAVQLAMGNLLSDKYAEGFPHHRFYAGCDNVDTIEDIACRYARELFDAEHAYVQPHSGADANLVAYWAVVREKVMLPGLKLLNSTNPSELSESDWFSIREKLCKQRLLGLDLNSGGHLTHGYRHNISGHIFEAYSYSVSQDTGYLDYDNLKTKLMEIRPLIFVVGYSAYPRNINFAVLKELSDKVGATMIVDMAHFSGLVAGKVFKGDFSPFPFADIVTSTTHKTLRGPRGGLVLCKKSFSESVDKGCPLVLGGPLPNMIAAKAIAFAEALRPQFRDYASQIVANARTLAEQLQAKGCKIITDGTDNHLVLVDVRPFGLTGRQAEAALRGAGITLNRNTIPGDTHGPWYTSGLRLGSAAVTTLGMKEVEMNRIADLIHRVLTATKPETSFDPGGAKPSRAKYQLDGDVCLATRREVALLLRDFPLYPELPRLPTDYQNADPQTSEESANTNLGRYGY